MKKYIATYWRANPQLANRGYETTREIEAKTISSARRQAREIANRVIYGSMTLIKVELKPIQELNKTNILKGEIAI